MASSAPDGHSLRPTSSSTSKNGLNLGRKSPSQPGKSVSRTTTPTPTAAAAAAATTTTTPTTATTTAAAPSPSSAASSPTVTAPSPRPHALPKPRNLHLQPRTETSKRASVSSGSSSSSASTVIPTTSATRLTTAPRDLPLPSKINLSCPPGHVSKIPLPRSFAPSASSLRSPSRGAGGGATTVPARNTPSSGLDTGTADTGPGVTTASASTSTSAGGDTKQPDKQSSEPAPGRFPSLSISTSATTPTSAYFVPTTGLSGSVTKPSMTLPAIDESKYNDSEDSEESATPTATTHNWVLTQSMSPITPTGNTTQPAPDYASTADPDTLSVSYTSAAEDGEDGARLPGSTRAIRQAPSHLSLTSARRQNPVVLTDSNGLGGSHISGADSQGTIHTGRRAKSPTKYQSYADRFEGRIATRYGGGKDDPDAYVYTNGNPGRAPSIVSGTSEHIPSSGWYMPQHQAPGQHPVPSVDRKRLKFTSGRMPMDGEDGLSGTVRKHTPGARKGGPGQQPQTQPQASAEQSPRPAPFYYAPHPFVGGGQYGAPLNLNEQTPLLRWDPVEGMYSGVPGTHFPPPGMTGPDGQYRRGTNGGGDGPYSRPRRQQTWLSRLAICLIRMLMVSVIVMGAVGVLFATTKSLSDVTLEEIENVLATEQELMMDLRVAARNPNVMAIKIERLDVSIFAKSQHIGSGGGGGGDAVYELDDPISDPPPDLEPISPSPSPSPRPAPAPPVHPPGDEAQTMLLGRIFTFASPLLYDGSPFFAHNRTTSIGQVRLEKPGNKTEAGGTDRWERVLLHPFELIVRGVLKYELPLSGGVQSAKIDGSVVVRPGKGPNRFVVRVVTALERGGGSAAVGPVKCRGGGSEEDGIDMPDDVRALPRCADVVL